MILALSSHFNYFQIMLYLRIQSKRNSFSQGHESKWINNVSSRKEALKSQCLVGFLRGQGSKK